MNRADEIRDQIRQMRYLVEEKKFIDDMIRRLEDQRNRLQLEDMSIRKIIANQSNKETIEEEVIEEMVEEVDTNDSNYFSSGTPSRPIEEPIVNCLSFNEDTTGGKNPKAVAEALELDVSQALLSLASGGLQHLHCEEEEEEEEDED